MIHSKRKIYIFEIDISLIVMLNDLDAYTFFFK